MFEVWGLPIVVGLTMLGVSYYFFYESGRLGRTLKELYQINQSSDQDALAFIRQAWPLLSTVGIQGLEAQVEWFGEPVTIMHGTSGGQAVTHNIEEGELKANFVFFRPAVRGEKKILTDLVIQTFVLIVSSDFSVKRQQVLEIRERLSRQQLFGQHDANNLVQFLTLLNEQLDLAVSDSDRLSLFQRIKPMMPVVMVRADRFKRDTQTQIRAADSMDIQLRAWLVKLAAALDIPVEIAGDTTYHGKEAPLTEALKNILENFKQHQQLSVPVQIQLTQLAETIEIRILANKPQHFDLPPAERLFEPFYTTSDSGMGLGLYLARLSLNEIGGAIQLLQEAASCGFIIRIQQASPISEARE